MPTSQQEFSEIYRKLPEEEIAALYSQVDTLTNAAQTALVLELQRRGLNGAQLEKIHATELRHESQFDRREKYRRKKMVLGDFPTDLKGWIISILAALVLIWISELIHHRH
jgi:hypothetical protein